MLRTLLIAVAALTMVPTEAQANAQIKCLADNAYHEARGQGDRGMEAVTHVVMNRVRSGKFPGTPCGVIRQRTNRKCQFSWVCHRSPLDVGSPTYRRALDLAEKVYEGNASDNTNGATFFHSRNSRPSWSRTFRRTIAIGDHIFYRGR